MKNIIKRYSVLTLVGLIGVAAILSSCEEDYRYGGREGETMQVAMTISTEFSGVESRAVFEPDRESGTSWDINTVTHCLLLIYNGTGNDAILVDTIKILDPAKMFPMSRVVPAPADGVSYRAIMLGNVLAEQLGDAAVIGAQLKDLNDYAYEITSGYNDPVSNSSTNEFTWSGLLDYKSEASTLGFTLNPNVAKIKVTVTDNSTESNVVKVQVKNVPNKVRFAQNALSKGGNFVDGTVEMTYIDYDIEELDLSDKKGELQTLYWYLPHNEAGDGNRDANPIEAPENATWVEFDGMRTADFLYTDYKIYPGIDEDGVTTYKGLKNFNVKADYQYRLNVNISDKGVTFNTTTKINETASGVTVEKVKLPWNSNCYMIHPLGSRTASGTLYELPINRINEYWGATYGVNDASMQIGDNTEWEAYVIWQDIPQRAIYFADKDGNVNKTSTVYSGTGMTPIYFKLANQNATSATQTYGNVLIGVRNKSTQTTLWSWHLWITDYNPDASPTHAEASSINIYDTTNKLFALNTATDRIDIQGVYNYNSPQIAKSAKANPGTTYYTSTYNITYPETPVSDGNVQHYHCNYSSYWIAPSSTVWDTGLYANKWIMDRNLGSQSAGNMHIKEPLAAWGLYYQFGRKDPFSYRITYDINGKERFGTLGKQWNDGGTSGSIVAGIKNPNTFFLGNPDSWAGSSVPNTNIWYNPTNINDGEKSVFDPCPPGWCVPDRDAFKFAENSSGTKLPVNSTENATPSSAHALFHMYFDAHGSIKYVSSTSNYPTISLTKLREKHRHMAMLCPSNTVGGSARFLYTVFPMQGFITAEEGGMDAILTDEAELGSEASARAFLWCARPTYNTKYSSNAGEMIDIRPASVTSSGVTASPASTYIGARLSRVYYGRILMLDNYSWKQARGQNVRCIQANGDTPKFHSEAE